ncbi:MAG TPA: GNAT family N-acetyltransferase [Patescibacteria group bacterium]|jgi:GNAT superfamily N-acetyltransferase
MENNLIIQSATEADFEKIRRIQKEDGYDHSYYLTSDRLRRLFQRGERFFITYLNEEPVGMFSLDIEIRAKLHFFSIIKQLQKKGIGREMLKFAVVKVKETSKEISVMYCYSEKNAPLAEFLKKNNFQEVGFYKNKFMNGRDAVVLEIKI